MKKIFSLFLLMLSLSLLIGCSLASPDDKEEEKTEEKEEVNQLATPKVSIDEDGLATWKKVKNADGYAYKINGGKVIYTDECSVQLTYDDSIQVKAISESDDYLDSEYSKKATYEYKTPSVVVQKYELGMGIVVNPHLSSTIGNVQVDSTVAVVVTDEEGKIVSCRIDALQNRASITEGVLFSANVISKAELKESYNMAKYGTSLVGNDIVLEWYLQAQAFEAYVVGKTVEEVLNMPMQTMLNGYIISADETLLSAGCTIQVTEFVDAVVKACNDDQSTTFETSEAFTLGVAINGYLDSSSNSATYVQDGIAALYSDYAAVVLVDGTIVAALNDAIQSKVTFYYDGTFGELIYKGSKRELKENYHMSLYGQSMDWNCDGIVKEWYLQSAAFSQYLVGKTIVDVEYLFTQTLENGYVISADEALLSAGCTIQITEMKSATYDAIINAR